MDRQHAADPPWWRRHPHAGVAAALALGLATFWITQALEVAPHEAGARLRQFVTLPFLLFVPAGSVCGIYLAVRALRAAGGGMRLVLSIPAAAALAANVLALAGFARVLGALFLD